MQCTYGHARYDVIYEILKLKSRVAKLDFFYYIIIHIWRKNEKLRKSLKILDLCEEIVTFKAFKDSALDILSNIKECVVAGIDNAKKWIVNAVNEAN